MIQTTATLHRLCPALPRAGTVVLHMKEEFTDVFATDGSKGGGKAAYGVPSMMTEERRRDENVESREEVETRMAEGMYGGALPNGWGVTEAEMAAVIKALQIAMKGLRLGQGEIWPGQR